MILGSVDNVSTEMVVGWVHSAASKGSLRVQATINNKVIGDAEANLFRPDLAEAKLGSGHCGFEIRFESSIDATYLPFVETRLAGGTLVLPRTSTAGFSDFFSALYKKYPRIGRHSSVLGGLWTDRSDAGALLKARIDIARVTTQEAGSLARFINDGLVVVDLGPGQGLTLPRSVSPKSTATASGRKAAVAAHARETTGSAPDFPSAFSRIFFNEQILRLLCTIFDDNPIAVKAEKSASGETVYAQASGWDDLPSPPECLALVAAVGDEVSVEVLRGSHRFPEFSADGVSRWTPEGRNRVEDACNAQNAYSDVYSLSPQSVAIVGPGLIHRVLASGTGNAVRILVIPSRQGSVRFRQQPPSGELRHRSGARIWISELT